MNKNIPKIIFFVTTLDSGGIENYLLRFLKKYEGQIQALIFCKGDKYGELENQFRKLTEVHLVKRKISYLSLFIDTRLAKFFKEEKFNTVCDFTGNFSGGILREAKKANIKNRIAFYRGSSNRFKETIPRILYNNFAKFLVLKYATSILSNSQAAFDFFFKRKDNRFEIIYNGLDKNDFIIPDEKGAIRQSLNIPTNIYLVGNIGRLHYSKNQDAILSVANKICQNNSNFHFILCGKNTENLSKKIPPRFKNRIHLLGYREDIPKILKSMDLFFFPSVTEGQPNALIEAMFMGLPIVASNIEPIKEMLPISFHKRLQDPFDINGFINEIEQIYHKKENMEYLKYLAQQNFNAEIQFHKLYNKLIGL